MFNEPRTGIFRWNAMPVTVMSWNASKTGEKVTFKISVCHVENCTTGSVLGFINEDVHLHICIKYNNNNNNISVITIIA